MKRKLNSGGSERSLVRFWRVRKLYLGLNWAIRRRMSPVLALDNRWGKNMRQSLTCWILRVARGIDEQSGTKSIWQLTNRLLFMHKHMLRWSDNGDVRTYKAVYAPLSISVRRHCGAWCWWCKAKNTNSNWYSSIFGMDCLPRGSREKVWWKRQARCGSNVVAGLELFCKGQLCPVLR